MGSSREIEPSSKMTRHTGLLAQDWPCIIVLRFNDGLDKSWVEAALPTRKNAIPNREGLDTGQQRLRVRSKTNKKKLISERMHETLTSEGSWWEQYASQTGCCVPLRPMRMYRPA